MTFRQSGKALLASGRWPLMAAALGALLTLPSLGAGLAFDDYFFEVVLRGLPLRLPQRGPLDLFRFADGRAETARALMDAGTFAWTADPTTRNAFLRPLSAMTHVADYALWPRSPALMHAQSIAWFALAVAGAAVAYRRLVGATWVAGFAALLYAIDDSHGSAVAWIANRNAFVAAALAFPVLVLHDRWRKSGDRRSALFASALLAAALLAGESAVAIVAYLAAYSLHVEGGTLKSRVVALAPYAAVVVLWRAAYGALGYGVDGSDLYLDPGRHPALFLASLPRRYLALLLGQFAVPRPDGAELYAMVSPRLEVLMSVLALVVVALLAALLARLWRTDPVARFFATGLLLSAIPICATAPGGRLLGFVGFGAMGLVAKLVADTKTRAERRGAAVLVALHGFLAPPLLALNSASVAFAAPQDATERAISRSPDVASRTVVLVNPPNDGYGAVVIAKRLALGEPRPRSVLPLAGVATEVEITRTDARTLRVRPAGGFLEHTLDRNWRSLQRPLPTGAVVTLSDMTATVTQSTPDGRPAEASFRFASELEDSSLLWLVWAHGAFVPWTPPALGETVRLRANGLRELIEDATEKARAR